MLTNSPVLPNEYLHVQITKLDDNSRKIAFTAKSDRFKNILKEVF
jgi:tRNA A37 threonylcarbamoyladenosine biosynthesis protein TsaE